MTLIALLLIGIGGYFALLSLNIPFLTTVNTNDAILIMIGSILIIYGYISKDGHNVFGGTIVVLLGIHFYSSSTYKFWIDHWTIYVGIIGLAFMSRYIMTRKGFFTGFILTIAPFFILFSNHISIEQDWILTFNNVSKNIWPLICIIFGIILLKRK